MRASCVHLKVSDLYGGSMACGEGVRALIGETWSWRKLVWTWATVLVTCRNCIRTRAFRNQKRFSERE